MDNIKSDIPLNEAKIEILLAATKTWDNVKYIDHCECSITTLTVTGNPDHTRLDFIERRVPRSNRITFETQSELNYGDSQHAFVSRNQRASFACVSIITTHYTARTNATDKKGATKKANSPLTCDLGDQGGCPACIQRRFKQSLWLHYLVLFLITSPPISGH